MTPSYDRDPEMRDACFFVALIAAAAGFALVLVPAGIDLPGGVTQAGLSPRFLPYILAGLVAALAAIGLLQSLTARPAQDAAQRETAATAGVLWRSAAALALLGLSYPLALLLGLPLAAATVCLLLLALGREHRLWPYPAVALGLPLLVTLFFHELLNVPLPLGALSALLP